MDSSVQRLLSDKLYDKRKAGALELEANIRNALAEQNHDRIAKIVHQLCHDFAYAVHQPHARNGGLIGLAAAAIALGSEVARYLSEIVPPVLACFADQDARVRYYACESMYNIAKVAKGEILLYFNDVFDALCKLAADSELSVKNGAELLDRLVKDIVSESAATYASILVPEKDADANEEGEDGEGNAKGEMTTAFSLPRFIPLLQERIHVLNPFTRTFLVSWIGLLDSIPDLELVAYLPSFLGGLLKYLSDPNQDVHTTTKVTMERFLTEIKKIAAVKRGIAESRRGREGVDRKASGGSVESEGLVAESPTSEKANLANSRDNINDDEDTKSDNGDGESSITAADDDEDGENEKDAADDFDEWIPGQDVQIDYQQILDILVTFLSESSEEEVQVTTLKWIESFLDICPEDILVFTPRLLAQVLPALSHDVDLVKQAANRVNSALMAYTMSLPEDSAKLNSEQHQTQQTSAPVLPGVRAVAAVAANGVSTASVQTKPQGRKPTSPEPLHTSPSRTPEVRTPEPPGEGESASMAKVPSHTVELDYEAAINALTLQFLHEHEATRVAALAWLIMLQRKSPRRILAIQDATFPALLKTLSDPAEAVVTRDLLLLSQISKTSNDDGGSFFQGFMVNLLKLFCTDRKLLETRGNLIIRQLCLSLSAERIFRTMADCLERPDETVGTSSGATGGLGDDIEFASIMVQNLNNNLITAPELSDLRKRLRNLDTRDGASFFTALFRAWCVNAVATFSLCLLAQAYEQAYHLLQILGSELEMSVNMLIQIDKLVQLLESPVFTYLRMQLLEPERYPFLYKCLYGLLMLLPQSSAFAALKNRLGSVSAIGYLHIPASRTASANPTSGAGSGMNVGGNVPAGAGAFERQGRLKPREEGGIRWAELLEKFKVTQEKVRRGQLRQLTGGADGDDDVPRSASRLSMGQRSVYERPESAQGYLRTAAMEAEVVEKGKGSVGVVGAGEGVQKGHVKSKSGLSQLGRFAAAGRRKGEKK